MTTILDKPKCLHREEHPIQECALCGAYLRTGNLSTTCDPCGTPPWEIVEPNVIDHIAAMPDIRHRRKAFEALAELTEREA